MLTAELSHHLANEDQAGKNHRNGSSPKKVLTPGGELQLDPDGVDIVAANPHLHPRLLEVVAEGVAAGVRAA